MQLEDYLDFQGPDAIRIKGHRIGLEHVVELYWEGYTPADIARYYPTLSLEEIFGALTYYLHNKDDIDAYMARINAVAEAEYHDWLAEPSPLRERILAARKQYEQEKRQQTA